MEDMRVQLRIFKKKGTRFVSYMSQDLKCEQCIFMDIFPFDFVAKDKKAEQKQGRKTNFWEGYCSCQEQLIRIFRTKD